MEIFILYQWDCRIKKDASEPPKTTRTAQDCFLTLDKAVKAAKRGGYVPNTKPGPKAIDGFRADYVWNSNAKKSDGGEYWIWSRRYICRATTRF